MESPGVGTGCVGKNRDDGEENKDKGRRRRAEGSATRKQALFEKVCHRRRPGKKGNSSQRKAGGGEVRHSNGTPTGRKGEKGA